MILRLLTAFDIGYMGNQRLLLTALEAGSLLGHHIFQGESYLYSFPDFKVSRGDYVVLYIKDGEPSTRDFFDATCHFLYYGRQLRLWEDDENSFKVVFRK